MESKFINYRNKFIANIIFVRAIDSFRDKKCFNGVSILDLGCGEGTLIEEIRKLGSTNFISYKGIDIKLDEKQKKDDKNTNKKYEEIDIEQFLLREKTEKYNFIVLQEVLEHLDKDKTISILFRTIFRLSSEGTLIVSVPNYNRLTNKLVGFVGEKKFMDDTHKFEFVDGQLDGMLKILDYEIVDKKYIILYLGEWIERGLGKLIPWNIRNFILKMKPKWASHFVYVCKYKCKDIVSGNK